jgi:multimeric flavodoxin WrbA
MAESTDVLLACFFSNLPRGGIVVLIVGLNSSPNQDGLTASVLKQVLAGAEAAGAETVLVHMKERTLEACRQCDNGWGQCRQEHTCVIEDDFQALREQLHAADALVFANPVYFGELSEVAKTFLDRLRRCEAFEEGPLTGNLFLGIAAAGGSGGGIVSCQQVLERYCQHMRMKLFDMIPVTRLTREYKLESAYLAGAALAKALAASSPSPTG